MRFDGFIGGSYQSQAATADSERTINWYVENMEVPSATVQKALYPTPGVTLLADAGDGVGRAHFAMADREFAVIGDFFWEIDSDGSLISRGSLFAGGNDPSTTPATINSNGDVGGQLFITASNHGFVYDLSTNLLNRITALDGKATMGGYLDGYFLALDVAASILYISALGDGATWSTGTDFTQRSLAADPWKSFIVAGRYIFLYGEQTTEIWLDVGARFPFAPIPSAMLNYGIAAPWSAAVVGDTAVWLATNEGGRLCVMQASGVNPQAISTHPLELAIQGYSDYPDAIADSYSDQGHTFYMLNFDASGVTHAWDAMTGLWGERGTWQPLIQAYETWRPRFHAYSAQQHRMLDRGGSGVYHMDTSLTTDVDGLAIRRLRRAPVPMAENKRVLYSLFELDLEPGLGTSGQGEDPQVMFRMSNDGGKTWGTEQMRGAGKTGEYGKRVRWHRLGNARRRVFEVSVTDPIPWRLTGAYLTARAAEAAA